MRAIDRKLLRDLWQARSQVVTVALVVASAFSGFAGSLATYYSLERARESFYESARFAQVFADVKRAPREVERRIAAIPGVSEAETTVVFDVTLDVPGVAEPVVGRMIGLPDHAEPGLDRLVIRRGRAPERGAASEVVVSEGFANTRDLGPGRSVVALVNGRKESLSHRRRRPVARLHLRDRAAAPFPDDRNFGVLWIARERLATAYDMEGAFNHVAVRLAPGASERAVIDALDRLLEPYGGMNAHGRDEQLSHRILSQEINQWKVIGDADPHDLPRGGGVPAQRRAEPAGRDAARADRRAEGAGLRKRRDRCALPAAGRRASCFIGIAIGIAVGFWWGGAVTGLYAEFFHFPAYRFFLPPWVVLAAGAVTLVAAVGGAMGAVRKAVALAPAEAMRPPAPGRYGPTLLERAGLGRMLTPAMRMVIRNMERRPLRALLTTVGIAAAMAIIISGLFWRDALDYMIERPVRGGPAGRRRDRARRADVARRRGTRSRGCPASC